jgi:probable F420-dependent oxidoreductase
MKFGFYGSNIGACANAVDARSIAQHAESTGFESLWVMDHSILPSPIEPPSVMPPELPIVDPLISLSYLAGQTRKIRLATGILLLPQRNPVILAKQTASLDVLSEGRLILGVGTGYVPQEYSAIGIPYTQRGLRMDEGIDALRQLWCKDKPRMHGKTVQFDRVDAAPRPLQHGGPPIVVGGESTAALQRAVTKANGWYGMNLSIESLTTHLSSLKKLSTQHERDSALGRLEVSVTIKSHRLPSEAEVESVRKLGVDRVILWPISDISDLDAQHRVIDRAANLIARFSR